MNETNRPFDREQNEAERQLRRNLQRKRTSREALAEIGAGGGLYALSRRNGRPGTRA